MVFCCVPIWSGKSRNINQYLCNNKISVRRHNQYFSTCTSKINIWSLLSNVWHKGAKNENRNDIEVSIVTATFIFGLPHYLVVWEFFSVAFYYLSWFWLHGELLWSSQKKIWSKFIIDPIVILHWVLLTVHRTRHTKLPSTSLRGVQGMFSGLGLSGCNTESLIYLRVGNVPRSFNAR